MPVHSFVTCSLLGCGIILDVAMSTIAEEITYERHIRPILKVYCLDCHGTTEELKGNLDLHLRRSMRECRKA